MDLQTRLTEFCILPQERIFCSYYKTQLIFSLGYIKVLMV